MSLPDRQPPKADLSDDIIAVAQRRDRGAFQRLFVAYAPKIKGYLKRQGMGDTAAEDLAQEVMLTVWRRAGSFDPGRAALSTWIYTIARNRRIDALRRERHPEPDPDDPTLSSTPAVRGDTVFEAEEIKRALEAAVADLPAEQADLLRVYYLEDETHYAIADRFGLPLGTVKSRLRLALAKLRRRLEDLS